MEMAPAPVSSNPRTVEGIFKDFSARRSALVRALTSDVDEFYGLCDPDKENLCLYGHANGSWEVALPAEEVPPELPEPALGINFARDGMNRRDWLSLVAVHSDSWLISVAFFFSARLNANERVHCRYCGELLGPSAHYERCLRPGSRSCTFTGRYSVECRPKKHTVVPKLPPDQMLQVNKNIAKGIFDACSCWRALQWKRLFNMINDLPTVYETLVDRKHGRDRSGIDSSGKSRHASKRTNEGQAKNSRAVAEEYDEDDEEHNETFCGTCGGRYSANEFWIGCDICERWFHGKCVRITPAKAEHIKHYKCPDCSAKKIRQ